MTLRNRNIIFFVLFAFSLVVFVSYIILWFLVKLDDSFILAAIERGQAHYLGFQWKLGSSDPLLTLISSGFAIIISGAGALIFLFYFRKISSPEVFFLALFAASLIFEASRAFSVLAIQFDVNSNTILLLSRLYLFGRFMGSLALLAASFHLAGLAFQYQGMLLTAVMLLSAALANYLPLDGTVYIQGFLRGSSYVSLDALCLILGLLSTVNILKNALEKNRGGDPILLLHMFLVILGHELLAMNAGALILVLAWTSLFGGMTLLVRRFVRNHLWY